MTPILLAIVLAQEPSGLDIMTQVVANVEKASEARRQYVYRQKVRSSLVRASGEVARREFRDYAVTPGESRSEKKLTAFKGEYRKGKEMIGYDKPGFTYKGMDIDGELIKDLTDDLVNDEKTRDGIATSLFPISTKDLGRYSYSLAGTAEYHGRTVRKIAFEPLRRSACFNIGGEDDCETASWRGETWIDAEDLQPARIETHLAFKMPWAVRAFLGTNLRQTGFSISYVRVAENVWFPSTYGTEFRLDVLWGYKRTITMSLESAEFQRTQAVSTIEYSVP